MYSRESKMRKAGTNIVGAVLNNRLKFFGGLHNLFPKNLWSSCNVMTRGLPNTYVKKQQLEGQLPNYFASYIIVVYYQPREVDACGLPCNAANRCGRPTRCIPATGIVDAGTVSACFHSTFCAMTSRAALAVIIWSASRLTER
jgi:hypothetical protein